MCGRARRIAQLASFVAVTGLSTHPVASALAGRQGEWTIPSGAEQIRSPIEPTPAVLKQGASIFESRCRLCHGPEGKGNGPLSDPAHPAADLTAGARADLAPDGVLFYRVWNGRRPMPAFKSELTREEVWAVVAFVKTLRAK